MTTTRIQHHIQAPRAQVYRALIEPRAVATWMVPDGMTSHVHEFDAQVGGRFRISLTYDAQTDTYHGHFVELTPNERVVETMEFETDDPTMHGAMTVTFTLTDANGRTDLIAVHDNVPSGIAPADNELGWQMALDKLAALVEGRQNQ